MVQRKPQETTLNLLWLPLIYTDDKTFLVVIVNTLRNVVRLVSGDKNGFHLRQLESFR